MARRRGPNDELYITIALLGCILLGILWGSVISMLLRMYWRLHP